MAERAYARRVWQLLETLHAVTYFADECRAANRELGLRGFWMGYFAARAAPLGRVGAPVVTAVFANFRPDMVARALPDAWAYATPRDVLTARAVAAATALRRAAPHIDDPSPRAVALLERVVSAADPSGRPLFAANRELDPGTDPVAALWQLATTLREHRGDGHVAALVAAGLGVAPSTCCSPPGAAWRRRCCATTAGGATRTGRRRRRSWSSAASSTATDSPLPAGRCAPTSRRAPTPAPDA